MSSRFAVLTVLALFVPAGILAQGTKPKAKAAPKTPAVQPVLLALADSGNEARFVVREQLARAELPNDAIGATRVISGQIMLDGKGGVDSAASVITVDLASLTSDRSNRDRWIKKNTLVVDSFPKATLQVTAIRGLPTPLPTSDSLRFTLVGNMTLHGVTTPTTWEVAAFASGSHYTGRATTHVKFGDFGMTQPRVMMVLSVVDDLKVEYDFHFVRQP